MYLGPRCNSPAFPEGKTQSMNCMLRLQARCTTSRERAEKNYLL